MRVLFWGTPEFATPALRALVGEGFDVAAVVTQPDRPVRRSRSTTQAPAVKQVAMEEAIHVLQPDRPRGDDFLDELRAIGPDISVVVAYGHILSKEVIDLPRLGTINIHASLLPKFRGAAPIQAAILGGLSETGVSIMRMIPALDAGPVILRVSTPIADDETGGELTLRLSEMGALTVVEALSLIELGAATEEAQDESEVTYAPKIDRDMTRVRWDQPASMVSRAIRAFDPRPGAYTERRGDDIKLYGARPVQSDTPAQPGTVTRIDDNGMIVACGGDDGRRIQDAANEMTREAVQITTVQPAGKRRFTPAEWARGRGIAVGERLA